jgi:hypothetical protein
MFAGLRSRFAAPKPVPTAAIEAAITAYANAALKGLPRANRNIKPFKNAANNWLNASRNAALGPAGAATPEQAIAGAPPPPTNYGLTQAYANLKNKINVVNKNTLSGIANRVRIIINESQRNNKPEVTKLRDQVQRELAKANALIKANAGLSQAIKSFMATLKMAHSNNNANYQARLETAFNQLKNLKPVFQSNYNNAMKTVKKSNIAVAKQTAAIAKAAPTMRNVAGASYFVSNVNKNNPNLTVVYKKANNGNGYFQGNVTRTKGIRGIGAKNIVTMKNNVRFNYNNASRSFMTRLPGVAQPPL